MSDKIIVNSWNEWDPLKHVIVGRADGSCIPAPEPALDAKVPDIEADEEFKKLNLNFNNMITRLKRQQDKLLVTERYEAWESVARKLAHEIKNPLTPIQLSIDSLREKYKNKLTQEGKNFEK